MRVVRKLAHFQFRIWNLFGVRERERPGDRTGHPIACVCVCVIDVYTRAASLTRGVLVQ